MSAAKNAELPLRIASALVLAVIVLVVTWYGGMPFRFLLAAGAVLIFHEWTAMTAANDPPNLRNAGLIIAIFSALLLLWLDIAAVLAISLAAFAVLAILSWYSRKNLWLATGLMYAMLPAVAVVYMRELPNGLGYVLLLFAIVWSMDIGAYFAGRAIGGPKLMPSVSPNKTWSGFLGGIVAAMLSSIVIVKLGYSHPIPLIATLALAILAQAGDLVESFVKRLFDAKDSSNLIPGHGGIMDRVDGLIFVAIAFSLALFVKLV